MSTHETVLAEADSPKNLVILGAVAIAGVFFIAIVIGIIQFFGFAFRDELDRKIFAPESVQLRQLRAAEEERLTRYRWVDKSADVVRIPLDRAMELTIRDWPGRKTELVGAGGVALEPAPTEAAPGTAPAEGGSN